MSPELIGITIAAVLVLAILCWLLLPRSKSAAPANIMLETRIPGAKKSKPTGPVAAQSAMKQSPAKPSAAKPVPQKQVAGEKQKHHGSPLKPAAGDSPPAKKSAPVQAQAPAAAPKKPKSKPKPVIDPKLTGQISELDDRLDAIEELVSSIEASLAEFDALDRADSAPAKDPAQAA